MKKEIQKKGQFKLGLGLIIAFIGLFILFLTVYTIPAGHRGVLLTFGKPSDTISTEGIHIKFPFAQSIKKMEVRTQKIETDADSVSLDLQNVQTTVALNFHLDPGRVNKLYQEIGEDYQVRIIDPAIQESVKAVMAQYKAEKMTEKRPEVSRKIGEALTERLSKYYIIVDGFNMVNFQFSEAYDAAIEKKVTAEQLALKAERDLDRIKIEAEQIKTLADAEAYALLKKNEAIKNSPEIVNLKLIEVQEKAVDVQRQAVEKWNGELPKVVGGATPFIGFESLEELGRKEDR